MKKYLVLVLVIGMMFASCERQSGKRVPMSKSGQAAMERELSPKSSGQYQNLTVIVIEEPQRVLIDDDAILRFKTKVRTVADSIVYYTLLQNEFKVGDKIEIKPTQRLAN